ncbi:hypothetical protein JCM6882_007338 [Rhodosporidiobolus microsporus]
MSSSTLLGTPVRPRDQRSTGAPSPYTPNPFRNSSSSGGQRDPPPPNPFSARTGSPLKTATNFPPSPSAASVTESQTDAPSSPRSSSLQPSHSQSAQPLSRQMQPTEAELKAQLRAAVAKTRIVADPSKTSAFRKEDDPELYALFVG